jgi:hypothetical protein
MVIPDVFNVDYSYPRPVNGVIFSAGYGGVGWGKYQSEAASQIDGILPLTIPM